MLNVRIFDPARPSSRTRGEASLRTGEGGNGITPGNGVSPIRHSRNQTPVVNLGAVHSWERGRDARKAVAVCWIRVVATSWERGRPARFAMWRTFGGGSPVRACGRDARAPRDPTSRNQTPIGG